MYGEGVLGLSCVGFSSFTLRGWPFPILFLNPGSTMLWWHLSICISTFQKDCVPAGSQLFEDMVLKNGLISRVGKIDLRARPQKGNSGARLKRMWAILRKKAGGLSNLETWNELLSESYCDLLSIPAACWHKEKFGAIGIAYLLDLEDAWTSRMTADLTK